MWPELILQRKCKLLVFWMFGYIIQHLVDPWKDIAKLRTDIEKDSARPSVTEILRQQRRKIAAAVGALSLAFGAAPAGSSEQPINLKNAFPNYQMTRQGYFLDGINEFDQDEKGNPKRSVLAFKHLGNGKFEMYNSLPPEDCHTDYYQWKKDYLNYSETSDECSDNDNRVILSPGIGFMPRVWFPSMKWEMSGTSQEVHIDHGEVACVGILKWKSEVVGREEVRDGLYAVHTQTNQETTWTYGTREFGCPAGEKQRWQENFFVNVENGLQVSDSTKSASGLIKSEGGNLDNHNKTGDWDWSVNFYSWTNSPPTGLNK